TEGQAFTGTVATFADANANTTTPASAYTATITWDDGTQSSGTITAGQGGVYTVTATHTFKTAGTGAVSVSGAGGDLANAATASHTSHHPGTQAISIAVTGPGGGIATNTGTVAVADKRLTGSLASITATEGQAFSGTVATFTDADAATTEAGSELTATITW